MVLVPAGSFQMGDSFNEVDSDEKPVHTVFVSAFYMDKYELTPCGTRWRTGQQRTATTSNPEMVTVRRWIIRSTASRGIKR
ncbi:SUMF1/EgtB/PvdO family nonheme iron enzyme [Candidatus Acetothermia bacterium]|nr:SUMF1/EgtB/PvdO family nonheme iron enzyme [Candidatus Acetothermia bacterium]